MIGLVNPITSSLFGGLWVVGRIVYGYGYSRSGPNGRHIGATIAHLGDVPLVGLCCKIAYDMITKQ